MAEFAKRVNALCATPTKFLAARCSCLLGALAIFVPGTAPAGELRCSEESKLATGTMLVCWKQTVATVPTHLLIHFHGAPETVKAAFARSDLDSVLVIVNFPGLSSAYSTPFAKDGELFDQILTRSQKAVADAAGSAEGIQWERVTVSSFSAGYGAVREILKTPQQFEMIDAIVAADSIYAGLQKGEPMREVDEQNMRDFLKFASLAIESKKNFIVSHSAQTTPYASTTETADYLLRELKLSREADDSIRTPGLQQSSRAGAGRFRVLGFQGTAGKDHLQHLYNIDLLWNQVAAAFPAEKPKE